MDGRERYGRVVDRGKSRVGADVRDKPRSKLVRGLLADSQVSLLQRMFGSVDSSVERPAKPARKPGHELPSNRSTLRQDVARSLIGLIRLARGKR